MAQDLAVPEKWYGRFDHVAYVRPNFDDELSPLNSLSFDPAAVNKERKARKILRTLLEQQADINENLADENLELAGNLRALLGLLQARDRQLESLSTTTGSVMLSAPRNRPSLARLSFRLLTAIKRRAVQTWRMRTGNSGLFQVIRTVSTNRLHEILQKLLKTSLQIGWKQLKPPKKLLRLIIHFENRLKKIGFAALQTHKVTNWTYQKAISASEIAKILMKSVRRVIYTLKTSKNPKNITALRVFSRIFRKNKGRILRKWREKAVGLTLKRIKEEKQNTISKVTDFSKRFLKLNQLCSIFTKREKILQTRRLFYWRIPVSANTNIAQFVRKLQFLTQKQLRNAVKRIFRSRMLPRLLVDLVGKRTCFALNACKISSAMMLNEEIVTLQEDRNKLDQRLSQALKRVSEAESIRNALERERLLESESVQDSVRELTVKLRRAESDAERDKLGWAQELKRQAEELATLKSQQSRLEGQLAQCQQEKSRLQKSENEANRQLASLSASVDRLAEERDEAQSQAAAYEVTISSLQDQLESLKKPVINPKRESILEGRIKDLESALQTAQLTYETKAAQKQKEVTNLQQLCTELKSQIDSDHSEKNRRLPKENANLMERNEELQRDLGLAKATNAQLSAQVLKLNKDITDLKIELRDVKGGYGKLQNDLKTRQTEMELLTNDLKQIQRERDRLIQSQNNQHGLDTQFRILQEQNRKLQGELQRIQAMKEDVDEVRRLREQLTETQAELEECRHQAIESREELATLSHELENYVSVFEVMDRKVGEADRERDIALRERDGALRELTELKQKYFSHFS